MDEWTAELVREFLQAFPDEQDQAKIVSAWRGMLAAETPHSPAAAQPHQHDHTCTSRQEPA